MTRTRPLRIALVAGLSWLVLLLAGCANPFKPADPEPPSGEAIVEDFSSIDNLFITMANAIQARTTNGANAYIHAFAESTVAGQRAFKAYHDPAVKAAWLAGAGGQPAPEPWTLALERGVYSELSRIRPNDPYLFAWSQGPPPGYTNDEEIATDVWSVHRKYTLFATPASTDPVIIASGFADLLIQKDGSKWSIFEWHDKVDPDYGVNPPGDQRTFTYYRLESQ